MFNFLPRNTKFFDYFDRDTEVLIRAAECFRKFLESSGDPKEYSARLKELEHEADRVTHEAMELLHRTFITPLERGDLRRLILRSTTSSITSTTPPGASPCTTRAPSCPRCVRWGK